MMHKGMTVLLAGVVVLITGSGAFAEGEIYKVVDENGNVIYTDQRPSPSAQPLDLPPLSVVKSQPAPDQPTSAPPAAEEQAKEPTTRQLRAMFKSFRIIQPQPEETFWGTANTVVVSWGADQPIPPALSARLFVDGKPQDVPGSGSVTLTLDRGEHKVYAELRDIRDRRIVTSETVTFFVKQYSASFNQPNAAPGNNGR